MTHKLLILNILLTIVLFYIGVHLNEQEKAVLEGLRPLGRDSYNWAANFFVIATIVVALFSYLVVAKLWNQLQTTSLLLGVLATSVLVYSVFIITKIEGIKVQDVLSIIAIYIILAMWLNVYALFKSPIQKTSR